MQLRHTLRFALVVLLSAVIARQTDAQLANGQSKFLGNIIASSAPSNFSTYWNQVTPENGGKWGTVQGGGQNSWNWSQCDATYNYAQSHGYKFKYHCLVWGAQQPSWVNSSNVQSALQTFMNNIKNRYPNIWAIDVVNEPIKTSCSYAGGLGGSGSTGWDWVITAFQMARNTFPSSVKLLINEYGMEPDANARSTYKTIINLLKSRGLIDGIGIQCHAFNLDGMSASQMTTCLNDLGSLGLPIYVSELDIRGQGSTINETAQKNKYAELFPVLWEHASVQGITLWGYIEGQTWLANTGILNSNGTERAAMIWLKSYMSGSNPNLSVSASTISIAAAANSAGTFAITSNTSWSVSSNQTWLAVSPTSGSNNATVSVTAQENTGTSTRSATVTVSATGVASQTVTVTQAAAGGVAAVNINCGGSATGSFTADQYYSGGSTYTNSATIDMSLITSTPPPAAIFNTERYGAMSYTIPNLAAGSAQTVTLYFSENYVSGTGQRLFNVSINGTTVLTNFDIYAVAGAQNRAIAQTFSTTANSSGQVVIQFTAVTQNPKISGITVSGGGGGNTLSVSPTSLSVAAAANSTGTFNVTSNTSWTVTDNQTWLTVSPTSGSNNATVTVTAQENTGASRQATVTVSATGVASQTVTVTQAAGSTGSTSVWLEAECASVGSLWNKVSDATASNGYYVTIQSGNNSTGSAPTNSAGYIDFPFSVSQSGTYYMFARLLGPTANDDSYWVRMDGGSWVMWNNWWTTSWTWVRFPNTFSLSAGSHTLTFAYREDGARLDKINLATSSALPTGTGSDASNLCTPKIGAEEQLTRIEPPKEYELGSNYPNPFNPTTVISFAIPENAFVSLKVYNALGQEIAELAGREYSAGRHAVTFNASNLASGVYYYAMKAGSYVMVQKMILQK
jgi:endo-1,4-beta-xylanase